MGSSATVPRQPPRGDRPGSVQIIRPLTPCLVTGQRGENPELSVGDPKGNWGQGSGSGSVFLRGKGHDVGKENNTNTITLSSQYGVRSIFSWAFDGINSNIKMRHYVFKGPSFNSSMFLLLSLYEVFVMYTCVLKK